MVKINEEIRQTTLNDINRLLTECLTDKQIMQQLDIPKSTYYKYKATLHKEAVEDIRNQRLEDIALHAELLSNRLKAILQPLLVRINKSQDLDSKISNRDLGSIAQIAKEIAEYIHEVELQRYHVIFKDKQLQEKQPELTDHSDSGDISTDENPIV
jgi:hypothetical protein